MRTVRIMAVTASAIFVLMQFIQPVKNQSSGQDTANDISRLYPIPAGVQNILQRACYDCHSNNTRYPWYAHIQPAGWWMASHVNTGKAALNFSGYGAYYPAAGSAIIHKFSHFFCNSINFFFLICCPFSYTITCITTV